MVENPICGSKTHRTDKDHESIGIRLKIYCCSILYNMFTLMIENKMEITCNVSLRVTMTISMLGGVTYLFFLK